jgi:uncharacterized membrane protein
MTTEQREILDEYVAALERALGDVPAVDRAEIVLEVRDHFEAAAAELEAPTEADLRNILERLGSPQEIASEARQRFGVREVSATPAPLAVAPPMRVGILEVGALLGWMLWTPVGIVLMALSPRWSRRTKQVAIVIELIAMGVIVAAFTTPTYLGGEMFPFPILFILFFVFVPPTLAGIPSAGYLTWKLTHAEPAAVPRTWRVAAQVGLVILGGWLVWILVIGPIGMLLSHAF